VATAEPFTDPASGNLKEQFLPSLIDFVCDNLGATSFWGIRSLKLTVYESIEEPPWSPCAAESRIFNNQLPSPPPSPPNAATTIPKLTIDRKKSHLGKLDDLLSSESTFRNLQDIHICLMLDVRPNIEKHELDQFQTAAVAEIQAAMRQTRTRVGERNVSVWVGGYDRHV